MSAKQVRKIYKVVYKSYNNGCVVYDKVKAVFPDSTSEEHVSIGVALVDQSSYIQKGNCYFAKMTNVKTVEPTNYRNIQHYVGVGVPERIFKGKYNDCVFFKEIYGRNTYIKAYDLKGNVIIKEIKSNSNPDDSSLNSIFYREVAEVITGWEDITKEVYAGIEKSILDKNSNVSIDDIRVLYVIKNLDKNTRIKLTSNNIIIAECKYNNLIVWEESGLVLSCWSAKGIDIRGEDITDKVRDARKDKYLLSNPKGSSKIEASKLPRKEDYLVKAANNNVLRTYRIINDLDGYFSGVMLFINLSNIDRLDKNEIDSLIDYITVHNKSVTDRLSRYTISNIEDSINISYRGDWLSRFY